MDIARRELGNSSSSLMGSVAAWVVDALAAGNDNARGNGVEGAAKL